MQHFEKMKYAALSEKEIAAKIAGRKRELGEKLLILGHHYQHESVFKFADLTGDSLKLARNAAEAADKKYIVFCGVNFMAESADILTSEDQVVLLPDMEAGCPMADMATLDEVESAWQELAAVSNARVVPVTYVNSSALIKAFVGEKGGSVCTSSNAERVLTWALTQGDKVFFLPDEHLGRNSASALNIPEDQVALWRRGQPLGGNTAEKLAKARVLLWNGYCSVHMEFTADQVKEWRKKEPEIKIIVHPESRHEVVSKADLYGSTEGIIAAVEKSQPGSVWAIGTEVNLVKRLQRQHPDKIIHLLAETSCVCATMSYITPVKLLWVLDNLAEGSLVNQVRVEEETASGARLALERMLAI
ncbi:MAG: quinolinate synthase NadA [Thermodesulfobacteriota bacterium]|nr:quinolinate synthase NadA [Thermodesulfobacteriota bacterium]